MSRTDDNRAESFDEQDPADGDKKRSKRPANTAFRQQRLKAWQPILTPKSVLPLFFVVGIIFAPIGGVLLWASAQVQEVAIEYSECSSRAPTNSNEQLPSDKYTTSFKTSLMDETFYWQRQGSEGNWTCQLTFTIPENMGPPVFLYYRLNNFYQNHRRYVQSLDLDQMKGKHVDNATIKKSTCEPLTTDPETKKPYYPCGLIANSVFNDSIGSPETVGGNSNKEYYMAKKGIAWSSDKEIIKNTAYQNWEVTPPPNWRNKYPDGYTDEKPIPKLGEDEDYMVWMRTAALPSFSKLSRRNDTTPMEKGHYQLSIKDEFPVTEYGGEKWILLSTRTAVGGKNPFMGIAYVVVGGTCVLLGTLFTIAHLVRPRKLGDHTYLTWNTEQESSAVTSGRDQRFGESAP